MEKEIKNMDEFEVATQQEDWEKSPQHDEKVAKFDSIDASSADAF